MYTTKNIIIQMKKKEILELLEHVKKYPGMHISFFEPNRYATFASYLSGYIRALDLFLKNQEESLYRDLCEWYLKKQKQRSNMEFFRLIQYHNKEKTEDEQILVLISIVENFFEETLD